MNLQKIHSLFLSEGSRFSTISYQSKTEFFIVDETSFPNIQININIGIFFDSIDYTTADVRISYQSNQWFVFIKDETETTYPTSPSPTLPYSTCQIFSIIINSYRFDFNLAANSLTEVKPINIAVTDIINMASLPELLQDPRVQITSSGYWQTITAKPTEIITTDYLVDISTDYQLLYSIREIFDYFNPT